VEVRKVLGEHAKSIMLMSKVWLWHSFRVWSL
jgi:hypothetical protein